jgi:broad specificity phosphatase PhoE
MKPRQTVSLAVVHARVPEHIARGLKLMCVRRAEGRQGAERLEPQMARDRVIGFVSGCLRRPCQTRSFLDCIHPIRCH